MSCRTCVRHGHTVKRCHETIATCTRYSNQGKNKDECSSTEVWCCHCGADHQTYSRKCPLFKREMEIIQIQTKDCVPRLHSIRKLFRLNPNPELTFSNAVKNTSNATTSMSPTRSKQESQSDSSEENYGNKEDNSPTVTAYGYGYYTKGKCKKKRRTPSSPLTVGCVRLKRVGKFKISRCKVKVQSIFHHKSKTLEFQVQLSYNGTTKELQTKKQNYWT